MKLIAVLTCTVCLTALAPRSYGQHFATLYSITGDNPIGLTWAGRALYGTTFAYGGTGFNCGTAYRLQPPPAVGGIWVGTVLYSFPDGLDEPCSPAGGPVVGASGTLYGTTVEGGPYLFGVFYGLQPPSSSGGAWTENVLYNFDDPTTKVGYAASSLVPGPGGSFYVLTSTLNLCQLQPPASPGGLWSATVLYSFPNDGEAPTSLVAGSNGILYGTSHDSAFRLKPPSKPGGAWTETVLHAFYPSNGPAGNPVALTVAGNGTIYGTAYGNDPPLGGGESTIFQLTPPSAAGAQWTYANLTVPTNTEHFNTPVVIANGRLYGGITTGTGGSIYELLPPSSSGGDWTLTTLYTFTNGQIPSGNLVAGEDGTIYGTTAAAPGQPSGGTVFAITKN